MCINWFIISFIIIIIIIIITTSSSMVLLILLLLLLYVDQTDLYTLTFHFIFMRIRPLYILCTLVRKSCILWEAGIHWPV